MEKLLHKVKGKEADVEKQKQPSNTLRKSHIYATHISTTYSDEETKRLLAQPVSALSSEIRDQVQMESPQFCGVCYNLDPSRCPLDVNPLIGSADWRLTGFRANLDHWDHHIMVKSPTDLLRAAEDGCIYCRIIKTLIDRFQPRWHTRNCYINISVGKGAPALVQLGFGLLFTFPGAVGPSTGLVLGGTRTSHNVVLKPDSNELPVELEIFKKEVERNQLTFGDFLLQDCVQNMCCREDWARRHFISRLRDPNSETMRTRIKLYGGEENEELPLLPDRVLWIEAKGYKRYKFLNSSNIRAKFIALIDYRSSENTDNIYPLKEKKDDVILAMMPLLFHDTIRLARALKVEYIWFEQPFINRSDRQVSQPQISGIERLYGTGFDILEISRAVTEKDSVLSFPFDLDVKVPLIGSISLQMRRYERISNFGEA